MSPAPESRAGSRRSKADLDHVLILNSRKRDVSRKAAGSSSSEALLDRHPSAPASGQRALRHAGAGPGGPSPPGDSATEPQPCAAAGASCTRASPGIGAAASPWRSRRDWNPALAWEQLVLRRRRGRGLQPSLGSRQARDARAFQSVRNRLRQQIKGPRFASLPGSIGNGNTAPWLRLGLFLREPAGFSEPACPAPSCANRT